MTSPVPEATLLRISKADKAFLLNLSEGVHIESSTSHTINELKHRTCADRLVLAEVMIEAGNKLLRSRPAMYRSAIGRYYYAMYHATRATVYFDHGGDDHEKHSDLPAHLPHGFPAHAIWRNELKNAREQRNQADYDPYPANGRSFRTNALDLSVKAPTLVNECRSYLKGKGCLYV